MAQALEIKDAYFNTLHGRVGKRYQNYPTFYRLNSPAQLRSHAARFRKCEYASLARLGQLDYYLPRWARGIGRLLDCTYMWLGFPGHTLAVRLEK